MEQLTVSEVKEYLGIDADFALDDSKIEKLITATRQRYEKLLGLSLIPKQLQTITDTYITELRYGPVSDIVSVADSDGNEVEYTKEGVYYPTVTTTVYPVTITYSAGYEEGNLPEDLKTAMLMKIQSLYDNKPELAGLADDMAFPYSRNLFL